MEREEMINQLGGIKLKDLDLNGVTPVEQVSKVEEESKEFENAVFECLVNRNYENEKHAIEEFWDCVQVRLSYLQLTLGITANEVMEHYKFHLEKIQNRPRD